MKILLAMNSFKESLESVALNKFIVQYLREFDVTMAPISDGGDGFLEVINFYRNCTTDYVEVSHPILGQKINVPFCYDERNIYIESAKVIGLALVPKDIRDPRFTSSYGLGELLKFIFENEKFHNKKIIIGIGGTATNDMGVGMASALNWEFLNEKGTYVPRGAGHLAEIKEINTPYINNYRKKIIGITDVRNPLIGKTGATYTFAEQKGLPHSELARMEKGLKHLCEIIKAKSKINLENDELLGAGGGLAAGLKYFLNAEINHWSNYLLKEKAFHKSYDFIITGEGKIDKQSFSGKVVGELLTHFNNKSKFILLTGKFDEHSIPPQLKNKIVIVEEISKYFNSEEQSLSKVEEGIKNSLRVILKYLHEIKK